MFLGILTDEQKRAFVVLAQRVIEADGVVVGAERRALAALQVEMGMQDPVADDRGEAELAALFDGRAAKVTVLLELLGLAYSDKRFTLDERSLITTIAHEMGIEANDLGRIDNWVREHIRLIEIALSLMAG